MLMHHEKACAVKEMRFWSFLGVLELSGIQGRSCGKAKPWQWRMLELGKKHAVRDKPICKASMCSSYLSKYRAMRILSSFSIGFKCPCSCTTNHNTERSIFDMRFIEADDRTCYFQII